MKIWERIILGFISVIIIMIIVDVNALKNNIQIINQVEDLENSKRIELTESNKVAYHIQRIKSNMRELLLELDTGERADEIALARKEVEDNLTYLSVSLKAMYDATHTGYSLSENEDEKEEEQEELVMIDSLNDMVTLFSTNIKKNLGLLEKWDWENAEEYFEHEVEPISRQTQNFISVIVKNAEEEVSWAIKHLNTKVDKAIELGIYLTILSILLSLAIGLYISRSISRPLYKLIYGAKEIGKGNLETTVKLETKGELQMLADSFNQMSRELKGRITAINKLNDELEESNQTKDKYFSIIAHDLRSPFNVILGFTDLLVESYHDFDEEERKKIIMDLNKSSKIIFDLLENLLTWSRSQSGKIELLHENINLGEIVENSIDSYGGNASQKQISLVNKISKNTIVHADEFTLSVVINNVLNNAIKFTHERGQVFISAEEKNNQVEVSIKDTGIGMNQKIIDNLFNSKKIDSTPGTKNEKGTGLGLVLIKDFIERNKGKLTINSKPGEGTEFRFTLPLGAE